MRKKKLTEPLDTIYDVQRTEQLDGYGEGLLFKLRRFPAVVKFWQQHMNGVRPSKSLMRSWKPTPEAAAALARLTRHMADAFNVSQDDARAAILGNIPPRVRLVQVANSLTTGAGAAITSRIHMEVSVLATPSEVAAAYTAVRRRLLALGDKARLKPPEPRTLCLARFAAKYEDAETERGRARWDRQHPDNPAPAGLNTWRRDLRRALDQVVNPEWLNAAGEAAFTGGLAKHRLDG